MVVTYKVGDNLRCRKSTLNNGADLIAGLLILGVSIVRIDVDKC
jgi:hypothetical protein